MFTQMEEGGCSNGVIESKLDWLSSWCQLPFQSRSRWVLEMGCSHRDQILEVCWVPVIIHLDDPKPITQKLRAGSGFSEAFWVRVLLSWRKEWHLSTLLFRGGYTAHRWRLDLSILTAFQKENLYKDHPLSLPRWWLTAQQATHTDNCTVV